jgi:hypothetical protein
MKTDVKLPIGIEDFEKIRTEGFYYVDKTELIKELLNHWGEVNLFTRPRRFGKSLNMSMLKCFLEYGCNPELFKGLEIAKDHELCERYMGKFPVISITLKGVGSRDFEGARAMLRSIIGNEALRFLFLRNSERLADSERQQFKQLITLDLENQQGFIMPQEVLIDSLRTLCALLHKHYGQKVILLIDEYDVPLDKAQQFGYYDEMIDLIRSLFGQALKSNSSLYFAVLTGCLRVSKESIFTGLNNPKIFSITNVRFDEQFGFTDEEVGAMLEHYGLSDKLETFRRWYGGYYFGHADIYCPWDVINYVDLLLSEPDASPRSFWINTSGNDVIRHFVRMAKPGAKKEIELLVAGENVLKKISQDLTYRDLYSDTNNLWSVLFATGYLTRRGKVEGTVYPLAIPNLEIRQIFIEQILEWFQDEVGRDSLRLDAFCAAIQKGDARAVEQQFNMYLARTISIRDTNVQKNKKENFYHGILLGLLSHQEDWYISSNMESGNGYSDILIELEEESIGIVIEVKYPDNGDLESGSDEALAQIEGRGYDEKLKMDGMGTILKYGIACNRKRCRVKVDNGKHAGK